MGRSVLKYRLGQTIVEYAVILAIFAVASVIIAHFFLSVDADGVFGESGALRECFNRVVARICD